MVRKKIGVVMETIQEKIEKSFKENSPRIAIKKGKKILRIPNYTMKLRF